MGGCYRWRGREIDGLEGVCVVYLVGGLMRAYCVWNAVDGRSFVSGLVPALRGRGGGNPAVVEWFMDGCGFLTRMTELVGVTVSGPTIYLGGGRQYHWIGYFGETSTAFHGRFHDGWISP